MKYRYDIGANVRAQSPAPQSQSQGKITEREFDSLGRLSKDKVVNLGGAYTRYEYPDNGIQSKVFSTIIDTNTNNIGDTADEVMSESWSDGAGRVRRSRTEHPGSSGGWSGSIVEYDILGQVKRQSVPTEISVPNVNNPETWSPAGDDLTRGWLWTYQKYDWKGRVTRKINTDGIDSPVLNDSDVLITYEGCGCAGGQVTTIQSENVPRDDQPTVNARRMQKIYADIQGRSYKTEVMNWDGTSVYTSTVQTFNGRDQVTNTKQYAGAVGGGTFQDVSMTYDGHGRMKTRHYPVEDAQTDTTWIYNADDSIQQVIDPRGAITNFTYNDPRGLTTQVSYSVPSGSTIPITPTTTFAYDNLGNRTGMATTGVNTTTYAYNELSRMTSETVDFDGLSNNLTIGYTYNLGGSLKSVTDPFNSTVDYTNDRTGRLTAVDGTPTGLNTTGDYASNIKYRAFGQVKGMDYVMPNGTSQIKMEYDNRLRVNHSETTQAGSTTNFLLKADYSYFADSRTQAKNDLLDDKWDRTNKYDFAGRLKFNQFGMGLATGGNNGYKRVYEQNISYDAFSQMTSRSGVHWDNQISFTESYANGRISNNPDVHYDAAGNIYRVDGGVDPWSFQDSIYDASGRRTSSYSSTKGRRASNLNWVSQNKSEFVFDGDGRPVLEKTGSRSFSMNSPPSGELTTSPSGYQVWSTVLGASLTSLRPDGAKEGTNVFAGGTVIARQGTNGVSWTTADPMTGTKALFTGSGPGIVTEETEPLGQSIHPNDPAELPEPLPNQTFFGSADDAEWQCRVPENFLPVSCALKAEIYNSIHGTGFYTIYDPNKKPGDPTFIHANDPPTKKEGAEERLMHEALHQTDKPKDVSHDGAAVQPSSMPNGTGEKQDDDTVYGPANGESRVTVTGGPSLPVDFMDASVSGVLDGNQKLVDQAVSDVTDIFNGDNECSRFFEQAVKIATIYSTEGGKSSSEEIYARFDATPAAVTLGDQLRNNIRLLGGTKANNTSIGIQMFDRKNGGTTNVKADGLRYNQFDSVTVNIRGPFLSTGKFGGYSGRAGRALAVLHELAHMILTKTKEKTGNSTPLIVVDGDEQDTTQSMKNTAIIEGKCRKELDALK